MLFQAASSALQTLAWDSKYVGGRLAMMAVLHTWSSTLNYHPHLHFIVPGGGLWLARPSGGDDDNLWLSSNGKILVPVIALSRVFRAQMQKLIKKQAPELYNSIPHKIWNKKWVVHSKAVGTGEKALQYLSEYVFRPAISNNRILSLDNNLITFKYKDSKTQLTKIIKLQPEEFLRRYLQHVLPKGFVKVRYFGIFSNNNRKLHAEVKESLPQNNYYNQNKPDTEEAKEKSKTTRIIICPHRNKPMRSKGTLPKLTYNNKSPRMKYFSTYTTLLIDSLKPIKIDFSVSGNLCS